MSSEIHPSLVWVEDVRCGSITDGTYEIDAGIEQIIADGGTGYANGVVTVKLDFNTMIPLPGMKEPLFRWLTQQKLVGVQVFIDGAYQKFEGKISNGGGSWEHAKGTNKGKFSFVGSRPEIINV
jgi:hypothetical protein